MPSGWAVAYEPEPKPKVTPVLASDVLDFLVGLSASPNPNPFLEAPLGRLCRLEDGGV